MSTLSLRRRPARMPAPALPGTTRLAVMNASVAYGDTTVLRDASLEVLAGEVLAVVGPNGAGKSTLLSVLAGDQPVGAGSVLVDGLPVSSWTTNELAMRRAVLLQDIHISFPFTVTQVVRMGRAPWVATPAEDLDDVVVASALHETETTALAERTYTSLSGGERARVALARVLAQEAGALLLDEPTAALDIRHQEAVLGIARARAECGDAVVVVLHDLGAAATFADRVAVLADGRIRAMGTPGDVLRADLLSEVYDYPIEVIRHPETGDVLIIPHRRG